MRKPGRKFEDLEIRHNGEVESLEIRIEKDGGDVLYHALHDGKDVHVSNKDYRACVAEGTAKLKGRMGAKIRERIFVRCEMGEQSQHYGDPNRRHSAGVSLTVFRFQESVAPDGTVVAVRTDPNERGWTKAAYDSHNWALSRVDNRIPRLSFSTVVLDYSEDVYQRLQAFVKALESLGEAINREMYPEKLVLALGRVPVLSDAQMGLTRDSLSTKAKVKL